MHFLLEYPWVTGMVGGVLATFIIIGAGFYMDKFDCNHLPKTLKGWAALVLCGPLAIVFCLMCSIFTVAEKFFSKYGNWIVRNLKD